MSKFMLSPAPFKGFTVYGPYDDNNGRSCVKLRRDGKASTMTVARYIMSVGLGRHIDASSHVDHADGDSTNDDWRNLQILSAVENIRKGTATRTSKKFEFACASCGRQVLRTYNAAMNYSERIFFCTRACQYTFNTASRSFNDKDVVTAARLRNNVQIKTVRYSVRIDGLKIKRVTRDLAMVLTFLARDDKTRTLTDFGTCACGARLKQSRSKHCSRACAQSAATAHRSVPKPTADELLVHLQAGVSYCALGRLYQVSDSAVRKWARGYGLV
jgi:hypothetical protein